MIEEGKYKELTGKIIGCAMNVHNELGCGFQEVIYQRALKLKCGRLELIFYENLQCKFFTKKI